MGKRPLQEINQKLVGERLVLLRMALGSIRQNAFAAMIGGGMTPQKLANYERGRHMLPPIEAGRICSITGADFDFIYRGEMGHLPDDLIHKIEGARQKMLAMQPQSPQRRRAGVKRA